MKYKKGFTLIELLVVIAIIGILAAVVLASLSSAKSKGNDAKIQSHLKSMVSQAQLFMGITGTAMIVDTPSPTFTTLPTSSAIPGVIPGGKILSGTLFNDTTSTNNGLYKLLSGLPSSTNLYYGWDGVSPTSGGKWFVAAGTSTGASCVDYTSFLRSVIVTTPSSVVNFTAVFPNAVAGNYSCQ